MSNSDNEKSSNNSEAKNNSGKWIMAVIIGGAVWVGVSPFVGAMLVKDKHLELSGKPPEPLNIAKSAGSFGYLNKAREGKPYTLPADLQGSAAPASTTPESATSVAAPTASDTTTSAATGATNAPVSSSRLSGLGLSGSGIGSSAITKTPGQADADAIRERFRNSIIALKPTASHSAATSSSSSSLGPEEQMTAVTKLCVAGKNVEGLEAADKFLAYIDKTSGIDSQYKVATAALAMQMADNLHQTDRAKSYSQTALTASRASEDYLIEKIEPVYYGLRGSKVNFAAVQELVKQYESDVAAARSSQALAQAKHIVAATASLPPQSFFRIKARIFLAHSQYVSDLNEAAARRELTDIKKTAEAAGDQQMAKACGNIINGLGGPI